MLFLLSSASSARGAATRRPLPVRRRPLGRRPWSLLMLMALFGLLLWGRLKLRDDVPRMALAEPERSAQMTIPSSAGTEDR